MATIDYHRRRRFINTIVDDASLHYYEGEDITCPCTDGEVVKMPPFKPTFTDQEANEWMASLVHECYHNMGSNREDFTVIRDKKIDMSKPLGIVLNIVVDHNIEKKRQGIYQGADIVIRDSYDNILPKLRDALPKFGDALGAMQSFDALCRTEWLGITDFDFADALSDEGLSLYEQLLPLQDKYLETRDGGLPNYELTLEICKILGIDSKEEEQEDDTDKSGGDEASEGGEGEAEADRRESDGDGDATGECEESKGDGSAEGAAVVAYTEVRGHTHTADGTTDITITYTEDDWKLDRASLYEMDDKPTEQKGDDSDTSSGSMLVESTEFTLSNKVRNYLKVMSQVKYQGGKKRGKIKSKSISSILTGNDRIFRSKEKKDVLDTAVFVLVDASGSMGRTKWLHAKQASLMINDCLNKLAIPLEIASFTTDEMDACLHTVLSPFKQRTTSIDLANCYANHPMKWNNNDGESILWAHDRLLKQKQKRKVLIVLSDGQPCGKRHAPAFTKKVVAEIDKLSPVELHGIGIMDDTVKEFYKNYALIDDASQLQEALLNTLKQSLV